MSGRRNPLVEALRTGQTVTVRFQGHYYPGTVLGVAYGRSTVLVRFATGHGRQRERQLKVVADWAAADALGRLCCFVEAPR
jgi:hypothetical protein